MLKVLFTLDYEIHGNGEGCPYALMIEPTDRLLRFFDEFGAKLTIMADVAEILKFQEYSRRNRQDDYYYHSIATQLQAAIRRGHDVQLHLHSSYFNAHHDGRRWIQDWTEYDLARLPANRLQEMIRQGKTYLETLLQVTNPNYRCVAFRAANWSVNPSANVAQALLDNGLKMDTSIFKFGQRTGLVSFNYANAYSDLLPWPVNVNNFCLRDDQVDLWEYPIYSENRRLGAFLTPQRIYRAAQSWFHKLPTEAVDNGARAVSADQNKRPVGDRLWNALRKQAWKADFNQCTGRQLIRALVRAERKYASVAEHLPFNLIGHSKLFTRLNEKSLRLFLAFVRQHPDRFDWATLSDFQPAL